METWHKHFLLKTASAALCLGLLASETMAADNESTTDSQSERVLDEIILPDLKRRTITESDIDSENFEVGGFAGFMNVEDFGTNPVYGFRANYHATEDFFLEAAYGITTTSETSFEVLSGDVQLLPADDRDLTYYSLSVGYNLFPGEVFIGSNHAFNTNLYLIAGAGNTEFAGDSYFTYNLGMGYRFYATDWLSINLGVRDYIFNTDLLGEDKTTHNIAVETGFTLFF